MLPLPYHKQINENYAWVNPKYDTKLTLNEESVYTVSPGNMLENIAG